MTALLVAAFWFAGYLAWIAMMLAERRSIRDVPELSRENRANLRAFLVTIVGVVAISPALQWATTWAYELNNEANPAGIYIFLSLTAVLTLGGIVVAAWFVRRNDSERVLKYSELRRDILDEQMVGSLPASNWKRLEEKLKALDLLRDERLAWTSPWRTLLIRAAAEQPDHPVDVIHPHVTTRSAWNLVWRRQWWQLSPAVIWTIGSFLAAASYHQGPKPEAAAVITAGLAVAVAGLLVSLIPFLVFARQHTITSLTRAAVELQQRQECHDLLEHGKERDKADGIVKKHGRSRRDHLEAGVASLRLAFGPLRVNSRVGGNSHDAAGPDNYEA